MSSAPYLLMSRHDYRTKRKVNMHFIARELALLGPTRFFSSSFSLLSRFKSDQRMPLWRRANQVELVDGVECYLWKTPLHPSRVPSFFDPLMDRCFEHYARHIPVALQQWIEEAGTIFLESGGPEIFFDTVKGLNPSAKVIYICSDLLGPIGTSSYAVRKLAEIYKQFDGIGVPARRLKEDFPDSNNVFFVPHGIDAASLVSNAMSPYSGEKNIVSVGNMLFDPTFFEIAAPAFPDVQFHIIGGGEKAVHLKQKNISVYGEMPFSETLPYIKFADAGVAPYEGHKVQHYLADTSMKLMQYGYYGIPSICPAVVADNRPERFGYVSGDPITIVAAVKSALNAGRLEGMKAHGWNEIVQRLLNPTKFEDTVIERAL